MPIKIIYEDNSIIIVQKDAGLATQSANPAQPDCVSLIKEHLRKSDPGITKEPYLGIVHRLDQPVAGILVFAKGRRSAAELSRQAGDGIMNKHYLAAVSGIVDCPEETLLTDSMYKDPKCSRAVITDSRDGEHKVREAKLLYRTEKILPDRNITILSISLITGRFHQIRAQLAHMGHPIIGDRKYGSDVPYTKGIALAADRLEFIHPLSGAKVEKSVDFSFDL
ncbi:MAG: RluA family pseudouridine synthase [Lachnospiraceae bacterium]|nr:RluA family pseudouridine synthase [Lachnospiraceae bacterium]